MMINANFVMRTHFTYPNTLRFQCIWINKILL